MKAFNILLVFLLVEFSAFGQMEKANMHDNGRYGDTVGELDVLSNAVMTERYKYLTVKDSLSTKFEGVVKQVCQAKGCWMTLELGNGEEAMVRFKDYGFFVPKNLTGSRVIVEGVAFVEEMSVAAQRHYAKDGGANEADIQNITEPKRTYGFEASGVLIKN